MYNGRYVFTQITMYLPQRQFRRIVSKFNDSAQNLSLSHWNHLLVLIFGQLLGCGTLRELKDITIAHAKRSNQLDSATRLWSGTHLPRPICFASPESSRSSLYIWCRLHSKGVSQRNSNSKGGSMPWFPLPSASSCPYSGVRFFAAQSPTLKSTPQLTSSPRYPYSTESPTPKPKTARLWTGLMTNPMPAISSTEATST